MLPSFLCAGQWLRQEELPHAALCNSSLPRQESIAHLKHMHKALTCACEDVFDTCKRDVRGGQYPCPARHGLTELFRLHAQPIALQKHSRGLSAALDAAVQAPVQHVRLQIVFLALTCVLYTYLICMLAQPMVEHAVEQVRLRARSR